VKELIAHDKIARNPIYLLFTKERKKSWILPKRLSKEFSNSRGREAKARTLYLGQESSRDFDLIGERFSIKRVGRNLPGESGGGCLVTTVSGAPVM